MANFRPGMQRVKDLYQRGAFHREIAEDPEVRSTLLAGVSNPVSRRFRISEIISDMDKEGIIKKRESTNTKVPRDSSQSYGKTLSEKIESFYEKHLEDYEKFLGTKLNRKEYGGRSLLGRTETVVISDTHIPDERMDLLTEIAARHRGVACCLAGDVNDFELFGRFDVKDWNVDTLKSALAKTDAVLEFLSNNFSTVDVLLGNHDLRLPRKAAKQCGPDYYFVSQMFLLWAYEKCHGVKVVRQNIIKDNGRELPGMFFYQQIGDCIVGHVEAAGRPVGKGSLLAHDFFYSYKDFLGLEPFKIVLQAHTHKQSFFRHYLTGVHCYEIGALCDVPAYSMNQPKYSPPQLGYFHLIQYDGVTNLDESRMYSL